MAKNLHEKNEIRPYALTPLTFNNHFLIPFKMPTVKIISGNIYTFKMNIISEYVYEQLLSVLMKTPEITFRLYNINFTISSIQLSNKPLLNIFSPQEPISNQVHSPNAWYIYFKSPTQFKSKYDVIIPFPLPSYIFNNLFHTWKEFFPVPHFITKENWFEYLEQKLYCRYHKVQTVQMRFGLSSSEIGFIGSCLIVSKDNINPFNSFLTSLLELCESLNFGTKRTLGFGVMNYTIKIPE